MRAFGLTGNIGCGKSTVASLLSKYGEILILNCDEIAKEIFFLKEYKEHIKKILGENIFSNGNVDFKKIANIIFNDPIKKRLLEELTHPLVWKIVEERVNSSLKKICVVESAIIFETHTENKFISIILATCSKREQFRRLRENRNMSHAEINARLDKQISSSEKEKMSQFVVNTDCDIKQLEDRVEKLYQNLKKESENSHEN